MLPKSDFQVGDCDSDDDGDGDDDDGDENELRRGSQARMHRSVACVHARQVLRGLLKTFDTNFDTDEETCICGCWSAPQLARLHTHTHECTPRALFVWFPQRAYLFL